MHCPQCQIHIPNPGRNCPACNASLTQPCPHCTFRNMIGQQFCGQCNCDLTAQRRQDVEEITINQKSSVTGGLKSYPVLSIEVMNLEQLREQLTDTAQVSRLLSDLMIRMEGQLVGQNATIESIRENVLFCAFREGMGMGELMSRALKVGIALSKKTIRIQDVQLQLRVGIDLVAHGEKHPMSSVPERLVAKAGQVVVSQTVYQLTNRQIPYDAIGPIKVQGQLRTFYRIMTELQKSAQAPAAPKTQEASTESVSPEPKPTKTHATAPGMPKLERKIEPAEKHSIWQYAPPRMLIMQPTPQSGNVGYNAALSVLETELTNAMQNKKGPGKIISLIGESGAGKSTIINLVRGKLPEEAFYWVGGNFFENYSPELFPLYTWLELIQNTTIGLPLQPLPLKEAQQHLESVLGAIYGENIPADQQAFFNLFLSLKPLHALSGEIRETMGQLIPRFVSLLHAMAQHRPLVLILENLEQGDSASIEVLAQMLQHDLLNAPITLLLTYSPRLTFTDTLQRILALSAHTELVMSGLDEATLITMVENPLAIPWKKLPDTLRAQLLEKGSPLFLEEAFRWLQMAGGFSIDNKTGKFKPEKPLKQLQVPEQIGDVIFERFSKQEEVCRFILQLASVLGERFSTEILNRMASELAELPAPFQDILNYLWQSGFIAPDTPQMVRFRHHLIWQTVYHSIDPALRQKYHQLAAKHLEQSLIQGHSINPLFIAHHYTLAGNATESVKFWEKGAVWLAQIGSVTGANIAFGHMSNVLQSSQAAIPHEIERRLCTSLGIINMDSDPDYAKNLFLSALYLKADNAHQDNVDLQLHLTQVYALQGNYPQAVSTLYRAQEDLPKDEFEAEHLALGAEQMWYLYLQGRYQEALWVYHHDMIPILQQTHLDPWGDDVLRQSYLKAELARARIALMQCRGGDAFAIVDEVLPHVESSGDAVMSLQFRLTRGLGYLMKGHYEGCQREMEPLLNHIEALGTPPEAMAWWGLIVMMYHCDMGDWNNASMLLPNISYQAEVSKDYLAWCLCQTQAGRIAIGGKNYAEAQNLLEQAVTTSSEYYLSQTALMGWRYLAENDLALGQLDKALEIATRAMEVALKPHNQNRYEYLQLVLTQAKILIAQNQLKQAGTLLESHWPELVEIGYTPLLAEAAYQIATLYGHLGDSLPEPHHAKYYQQRDNFLEKAKTLWHEQGNQYRLAPFYQEQKASLA